MPRSERQVFHNLETKDFIGNSFVHHSRGDMHRHRAYIMSPNLALAGVNARSIFIPFLQSPRGGHMHIRAHALALEMTTDDCHLRASLWCRRGCLRDAVLTDRAAPKHFISDHHPSAPEDLSILANR